MLAAGGGQIQMDKICVIALPLDSVEGLPSPALEVSHFMRYINLRITYSLT